MFVFLCTVVSLCDLSVWSQLRTVLLCLWRNSLLCLLLFLTVVTVSLIHGFLWASHKDGALHHFGFGVEYSFIKLPGTWTDISVGNSYCLHQFGVIYWPQLVDSGEYSHCVWSNSKALLLLKICAFHTKMYIYAHQINILPYISFFKRKYKKFCLIFSIRQNVYAYICISSYMYSCTTQTWICNIIDVLQRHMFREF